MSAVAAFSGPWGALAAPFFGVAGGLFGSSGATPEPLESVLRRVVSEALLVKTDRELESSAAGEMVLMAQNVILLTAWNNVVDKAKLKESGVYDTLKVCVYICAYVVYIYTYIYICIHTYICIYMCINVYIYRNVYLYVYI
jgi:hypothetical protein